MQYSLKKKFTNLAADKENRDSTRKTPENDTEAQQRRWQEWLDGLNETITNQHFSGQDS